MKGLIKEYLLENWSLKATALLLALILWALVRGEPSQERGLPVPLEVLVPRNMEIANDLPTSAAITYRGPALSSIGMVTCVIDLRNAKEGGHTVSLTSDNVRMTSGLGIEILQVNPARVRVVLEKTVSREVPIVASIEGDPAKGFEVYSTSLFPETVILSGPRSRIEPVQTVDTETISIEDKNQTSRFYVNLALQDNTIRTSVIDPVQVIVRIGPFRKLHTIEQVPVRADDDSYTVNPKQINIQVLAPPELIPSLTPADFVVTVETKNLEPSNSPLKIKPSVLLLGEMDDIVDIKEIRPPEVSIKRKN